MYKIVEANGSIYDNLLTEVQAKEGLATLLTGDPHSACSVVEMTEEEMEEWNHEKDVASYEAHWDHVFESRRCGDS